VPGLAGGIGERARQFGALRNSDPDVVLMKLMGLLLAAPEIQFIAQGIQELLPSCPSGAARAPPALDATNSETIQSD